jgi:hypothetical protein
VDAGRNRNGFFLPRFQAMQYERRQVRRSLEKAGQAAFLALGMGFASLFALAADFCFTFCPMASVSTL